MSNTRLTQRQIDALKPRKKTFDLRDTELKGFGVRVRSSGIKRYFVQSQHEGTRTWRIIGNAAAMTLEEARYHARPVLASLHNGEEIIAVTDEETRFEVVAEKLFEACERHWKAGTRKVNRYYLKNQLLPWFQNMQIAGITERDVKQWHALAPCDSLRRRPCGARAQRYPQAGRGLWLSPGGFQPLCRYQTIPAAWPRALSLAGRNAKARRCTESA